MGKISELSECELITMKCIWDAKEPVTCAEIIDELKNKYNLQYKDTTVYTFIKKLRDKEFVGTFKKGITYFFPLRDEESYKQDQLRWSTNFWYHDSPSELVACLFRSTELSASEKQEIQKLIDELD